MKTKDTNLSIRYNRVRLAEHMAVATDANYRSFTAYVEAALDEKTKRERERMRREQA